ncbi:hypothetical protein [Dongia sp.]|uniref:hypothetical protein n=1 Tax=Dongia sp. TaxID=1977262 RepID=UPI0035B2E4F2
MLMLITAFGLIFAFIGLVTERRKWGLVLLILVTGAWAYHLTPHVATGEELAASCQDFINGEEEIGRLCERTILSGAIFVPSRTALSLRDGNGTEIPFCIGGPVWNWDESIDDNSNRLAHAVIAWSTKNPERLTLEPKLVFLLVLADAYPCPTGA